MENGVAGCQEDKLKEMCLLCWIKQPGQCVWHLLRGAENMLLPCCAPFILVPWDSLGESLPGGFMAQFIRYNWRPATEAQAKGRMAHTPHVATVLPIVLSIAAALGALVVYYRKKRDPSNEPGSDEECLRHRMHPPPEGSVDEQVQLQPLSAHGEQERPPKIAVVGDPETIKFWIAKRGHGEGLNIDGFGDVFIIVFNPSLSDMEGVDSGIILWDASQLDKDNWKAAKKPVMIESQDPRRDELPLRWALSLTDPFPIMLAKIHTQRNTKPKVWAEGGECN
ncbi:hypothetical protein F66182_10897 [Fusarium sp. NRRL 66182]|nr:hypothetical protein F66182_10897 [Fusarium sp. NRRL 66182]